MIFQFITNNYNKPEALAVQAIVMKPVEQLDLAGRVREVLAGRKKDNCYARLGG